MINRKLLVEALRVDNKDVLPKFGSPELRKMLEAATEYIAFSSLVDPDDGSVTDEGIYAIMDLLERGSAGVADEEGQPALNFIKNGPEIIAHNMFTDEDEVIDATPEALKEYIGDQMEEPQMEARDTTEDATVDAENVIFKREPNEYTDETDILAVFPDIIEQPGDEGRILTYSHVGQHGYASFEYVEELEDATPEEYEPLKEELEGQGYVLNVLNGLQGDESVNEKELQNYGVCVAEDKGNDVEILGIKTGYHSFEEAQSVINDMETDFEFQDDPTMMLFVVYSDGTSWFNAVTGEEVPYEQNESVHEASNAFKTVREARSAVSRAKRVLQKELDKGNFKENFGRDKVRELKNRIPVYADDMDQDDLKKIQDIVSEFDEWCSTVTPNHEALEVKQYNKLGKDDYRNKTTEYSCNTMVEVRKIFKNSSELDKIDKVEVHQDGKLLYVGTPVAPSEDNKRWSFSWKKESLDDEAAVIIDEIHRKIVVAADSIKRSLTTKANFMNPNRVLNALDELNSLVDQDIEDLINSVDQRLD